MDASGRPTDIVTEIEAYLDRHEATGAERTMMRRALAEINSLRNRGDSPLALRNSELSWENRRLREENKWLRVFGSVRVLPPMERSK